MAEEEYELFLSEKLAAFLPFHEVIKERFFPTLFIQWILYSISTSDFIKTPDYSYLINHGCSFQAIESATLYFLCSFSIQDKILLRQEWLHPQNLLQVGPEGLAVEHKGLKG